MATVSLETLFVDSEQKFREGLASLTVPKDTEEIQSIIYEHFLNLLIEEGDFRQNLTQSEDYILQAVMSILNAHQAQYTCLFTSAYYDILFELLANCKVEDDLKLKAELSKELISSPNEFDQEVAYANLADALFDMGNYKEAERYAIMGKDLRGTLSEYNHDHDFLWGMCWCIYARCQEEAGDMEYAMILIEKGASLGIPWCERELKKLKQKTN